MFHLSRTVTMYQIMVCQPMRNKEFELDKFLPIPQLRCNQICNILYYHRTAGLNSNNYCEQSMCLWHEVSHDGSTKYHVWTPGNTVSFLEYYRNEIHFYTPRKLCLWESLRGYKVCRGYTVFTSVRLSVHPLISIRCTYIRESKGKGPVLLELLHRYIIRMGERSD